MKSSLHLCLISQLALLTLAAPAPSLPDINACNNAASWSDCRYQQIMDKANSVGFNDIDECSQDDFTEQLDNYFTMCNLGDLVCYFGNKQNRDGFRSAVLSETDGGCAYGYDHTKTSDFLDRFIDAIGPAPASAPAPAPKSKTLPAPTPKPSPSTKPTPSPVASPSAVTPQGFVMVKPGDTCDSIATAHNVTVAEILKHNPKLDGDCSKIMAGYPLNIKGPLQGKPTSWTYVAKKGDTCLEMASSHNISLKKLHELNPGLDCSKVVIGKTYTFTSF